MIFQKEAKMSLRTTVAWMSAEQQEAVIAQVEALSKPSSDSVEDGGLQQPPQQSPSRFKSIQRTHFNPFISGFCKMREKK